MKKNTILKKWVFLFIFFIATSNHYTQVITETQNPYSLGTTNEFLKQIQAQLATISKNNPEIKLPLPHSETLHAKVNYLKERSSSEIHLEGEILGRASGSFSLVIKDKKLEGRLIFLKDKKAYTYYSDNNEEAFIKEDNINNIICTDFIRPSNSEIQEKRKYSRKNTKNIDIANLQSLPGAAGCLLLDFDGHYLPAGSGWNAGNPINAAPSGMNSDEILEAWEITAEDFRAFNLNVTTNEAVFNTYPQNKRRRCVVTTTDTAYPGGAGFALVNNFSSFSDLPCWAFTSGAGTYGKYIGEILSHEFGHTLGLRHDGQNQYTYYSGHGNWAPIMGAGYYRNVTQWSKAEYTNGTNHQDDLAIITSIANGVGYRVDDHGNTSATATPLVVSGQQVSGSQNQGVIGYTDDIDLFSFTTSGGNVKLNIQATERHSNLLLKVDLYNEKNTLMGTYTGDPWNLSIPISINTALNPGKYYVAVSGIGEGTPDTGYTSYSSLGIYSISGFIPSSAPFLTAIDKHQDHKIRVYPNPVIDELTIETESKDHFDIQISNSSGLMIYQTALTSNYLKIPFSDKPAGLYLITLRNRTTQKENTFKIIKK